MALPRAQITQRLLLLGCSPHWSERKAGDWKQPLLFVSLRLASPEKRHNNEKPPLEEEKKEKIELKSITSDGETNTATKVGMGVKTKKRTVRATVARVTNEPWSEFHPFPSAD